MSAILGTSVTGSTGAYTIDNSVRLRSSASAYLSRTPSVAGNQKTWTWSGWVKRGLLSSSQVLFGCRIDASNDLQVFFDSSNRLTLSSNVSGAEDARKTPTMVFRDPSAWYHIVIAFDAANTVINFYINGVQVTAWDENNQPSNVNAAINSTSLHRIAISVTGNQYFDGYLTEVNFIDGQALTPSSFGATNASTGVWQPTAYTGTYGTNGFYLKFSDIATTSGSNAGLGKDFSGNGNYWNTNNISVTSGVTYDAMTDSPTPKSSTVGNYCVMSPISIYPYSTGSSTVTNGNLTVNASSGTTATYGTMSLTAGKWYWEVTATTVNTTGGTPIIGVQLKNVLNTSGYGQYAWGQDGIYSQDGGGGASGFTFTTNDLIMVAYDADSGKLWFGKNGTWNSGSPSAGTSPAMTVSTGLGQNFPVIQSYVSSVANVNFGQRPFSYTPPTGFKAVNVYNLPTPTIGASSTTLANKYFNAVTYTGTGTTQSITGVGFQPDFVWVKGRNIASSHQLYDINRGVTKQLASDLTSAEFTTTAGLTAFGSDGFTGGGVAGFNGSGNTFVSWNWKGSNTTTSNTSGSITSTVSANTTSGFSVVTFTSTSSTQSVGHGLGVAPSMIILKNRSTTNNWGCYHKSLGNNYVINLNSTSGQINISNVWATSSTTFTPDQPNLIGGSGVTCVAYCFSEVAGFSKFGSYTGNGSTDGTFVYTGFRPRYVMMKRTDTSGTDWILWDAARNPSNVVNAYLAANLSDAETTAYTNNLLDFVSNGFKLRQTASGLNASGGTYIYMAFAESPFNYSLAR